jgi:hypothetical protein
MKNKLTLLIISAMLCGCEEKLATDSDIGGTGSIINVNWVRARDWTTLEHGTNYAIDFGFRQDGVLLWRRGDKL